MQIFGMELDMLTEECRHVVETMVVPFPEAIDVVVVILHQLLCQVVDVQKISKLIMACLLHEQWNLFSFSIFQEFC